MKKIFLFSLSLIFCSMTVYSSPALRDSILMKQPDGKSITVFLQGDEHAHLRSTRDGYPLMYDADGFLRYAHLLSNKQLSVEGAPVAANPESRTRNEKTYLKTLDKINFADFYRNTRSAKKSTAAEQASPIQIGNFPTKNEVKSIVILVEFSDNSFSFNQNYHERMMNEVGFSDDGATGSARDYFLSQSMDQFNPHFDVVGPVKLSRDIAYYGKNNIYGNDQNATAMIKEACEQAKSQFNCDFTKYDNDGDGVVDMVYVIYAGYGEHAGASSNTIWPHKFSLASAGVSLRIDGKKIETYACSSELAAYYGTVSSGIGTFCHEFSHVLGLPDFYVTSGSSNAFILGEWSIMEYGCYNNNSRTPSGYSAFERYSVGWLTPKELSEPQKNIALTDISESNDAYRLSTSNSNEFFMLENRQQKGWDTYLPGSGLMITHIDYNKNIWGWNTVNNDLSHPRVQLEVADGKADYDSQADDLFPNSIGNNSFTDESTPSSLTWKNEKIDKGITNISNDGGVVHFNYKNDFSLATPSVLSAQNLTKDGFTAVWDAVSGAESYTIRLNKLVLDIDSEEALSEDFSGMKAGSEQSPDALNIASDLDKYMIEKGWSGDNVYQAGGICRLGGFGFSGSLTTPPIHLASNNGAFTLLIKMKSLRTVSPQFTVTSGGQTATHRINGSNQTYLYVFSAGTSRTSIKMAIAKERAFIESIVVIRGDATAKYADATVVDVVADTVSPTPATRLVGYLSEEVQVVEGITDLNYQFSGLDAESYSYTVEAVSNSEEVRSQRSDEMFVDLSVLGIDDKSIKENWFVLSGRTLTISDCVMGEMVYVYSLDGRVVVISTANADRVQIELPDSGFYIVSKGASKRKILVR